MKAFLKFDYNQLTKKLLEDKLSNFGLKYNIIGFGEIEFLESVPDDKIDLLRNELGQYGITIIENQKSVLENSKFDFERKEKLLKKGHKIKKAF